MKKRVKKVYCDTDKDILAYACVSSEDPDYQMEAYYHRNKQFCYLYKYKDMNGDKANEEIIPKSRVEMNTWFDRYGAFGCKIFTDKKEFDAFNSQSESEVTEFTNKKDSPVHNV